MIDPQPSGRRWGWPVLALLSLAALMAGAWWLASARPGSAAVLLPPGASQPPQSSRPARPHPHPASMGASEAQRRHPPLQTAAGEAGQVPPAGRFAQGPRQASMAPGGPPGVMTASPTGGGSGEGAAGSTAGRPARVPSRPQGGQTLPLKAWLPL